MSELTEKARGLYRKVADLTQAAAHKDPWLIELRNMTPALCDRIEALEGTKGLDLADNRKVHEAGAACRKFNLMANFHLDTPRAAALERDGQEAMDALWRLGFRPKGPGT